MGRTRVPLSAVLGAILGAVVVVTTMVATNPGWGFFSHTQCQVDQRVGNLTVWLPAAVVASPYHGSESGSVTIWGESPLGTSTLTQATTVIDGNVTAYYVDFTNWTVFSLTNHSENGPGPVSPCSTSLVGYFSDNPSQGLRSGGATQEPFASQLVSDINLNQSLNGSQLCKLIENTSYQDCAIGAQFDMNFQSPTGTVDTCGMSQDQVLRDRSEGWPISASFQQGRHAYTIPLDPSGENSANYANGTYAWYNYTFPADGGIWQYDNLADTSDTGAGLVFAYSPCP